MSKTALITGASSGIGSVFARELAQKGYDVVLAARTEQKLQELAQELARSYSVKAYVVPIDLSKEFASRQLLQQITALGLTIDLLINNAGFGTSGEFLNNEADRDHQQVMLNVTAVVDLTHTFLPGMVERGAGGIINLGSIVSFQPNPYMAVYGATKAFVLSFSQALWAEYRNKGIKVVALCPGPTETNFFKVAGEVQMSSMRSPQQAVRTALRALDKNKSFVVDGFQNSLIPLLGRLLSRRRVTLITGSVLRKSLKKK